MAQVKAFSLGGLGSPCCCSGCVVTVCVTNCSSPVVGATVTIKSGSTTIATGTTNSSGCAGNLNIGTAGTYTIVIAASGHTTTTLTGIHLDCGQTFNFDFTATTYCLISWCNAPYTCGATITFKYRIVLTQATKSGSNVVYAGALPGGPSLVGKSVAITGFTNAGNNGTFTITAVSGIGISFTVVNGGGVNETHAAAAVVSPAVFSGTTDGAGCLAAPLQSFTYEVTIESNFPTIVKNQSLSCGGSTTTSLLPTPRNGTLTDANGTYTLCDGPSFTHGAFCYYINNGKPICAGDTSYFVGYTVDCEGSPAGKFILSRYWVKCAISASYAGVNNGGICNIPTNCNFSTYASAIQGCLTCVGTPDPCDPTGAFTCTPSSTSGAAQPCPNNIGDPVGGAVSVSF